MFVVGDANERRELCELFHDNDHFMETQQERRRSLQRLRTLLQASQRT